MTPDEKSRLSTMRKAGRSYTEIADALGISKNTIKTFCRRNGLTPEVENAPVEIAPVSTTDRLCPHCGKPVIQPQGRKEKKFCSDTCRNELVTEDGKKYPPKYVIAVAAHFATRVDISTDGYTAVEAKSFLQGRGFNIEIKQEKYELNKMKSRQT